MEYLTQQAKSLFVMSPRQPRLVLSLDNTAYWTRQTSEHYWRLVFVRKQSNKALHEFGAPNLKQGQTSAYSSALDAATSSKKYTLAMK
jgi:hypothetical protein